MTDRVSFIKSITGINYPDMIVKFFDHFLALKEIVDNSGSVSISSKQLSDQDRISFNIRFSDPSGVEKAAQDITQRPVLNIYDRQISVAMEVLSKNEIQIILQ